MTHYLKILVPFANAVIMGEKTFEIRNNDRGFQKGDLIQFYAVVKDEDGDTKGVPHPINEQTYVITYVLGGEKWGIRDGFVVFGIGLHDGEEKEAERFPLEKVKEGADILKKIRAGKGLSPLSEKEARK